MKVGIPRETKPDEYRVAMTPDAIRELASDGHEVLVEVTAGKGAGFSADEYAAAGARIMEGNAALYAETELVIKVKEPQPDDIQHMRPGQVVFGYFHLAGSRDVTQACLESGITAVAYETLYDEQGHLPLLKPMSEIAGKMSAQEGARFLENPQGGRGVLLSGVAGARPAKVVILGGGTVGTNAAVIAAAMGANVVIMDINRDRLAYLEANMPDNVSVMFSKTDSIARQTKDADLVVGAVMMPGKRADQLINRELLQEMLPGSVLVDVSIDQGGCSETSRPTTHSDPVYVEEGVIHYCVTNIPGAVGRTGTQALCHATLPYCRELAGTGLQAFVDRSPGRMAALNIHQGMVMHPGVLEAFPDMRA